MTKNIIYTASAPEPIGPYSQAVLAGNTLYVSGQIAIDAHTNTLVNENIELETAQVLKNMRSILQAAGFDFEHVVKCTIFLKDFNDFATVNAIYGKAFTTQAPARETVEVSRLPKDVNIEISCIAVK
ncbi:MAG: RidA family protein [Cyclobacteriaceae bacterium]|jgi:2-iminobutanoate/2-iminopropanoate deaminase|nr:RidA family protein [Cyclobacteriaceae bacterium]